MKRIFSIVAALLLLLLAACNTAGLPEASQSVSHVLTVDLEPGDTEASLKERFGGEIMVMGDDFAVISFKQEDDISLAALADGKLEKNTLDFKSSDYEVGMNGTRAWASGTRAWASGTRAWASATRAWASGQFELMPENTGSWKQIGLDKAYGLAPNLGNGVKVAIIDTGVDLTHPALLEALAPASEWKDYVDGDALPQEEGNLGNGAYGHGTIIAGIVRQIAPSATILPIRILNSEGAGYMADLVSAVDWALQMKADIINLSLGSDKYSLATDYVIAKAAKAGVLVVAASGNSGDEKVLFPAYRSVALTNFPAPYNRLSVGSVNAGDEKSPFSTYGYTVELTAPGESIYGPAPDMMVASWTGTSMAAPVAAGALALALGEELNVARNDLIDTLVDTATNVYSIGNNSKFAYKLGHGRINLETFLNTVLK
ncbi:MAG: S8 family serine peptidase [Trueperaceae bacterium]|nr:S8 family serine peptidase [Trueperaceae bacterium]